MIWTMGEMIVEIMRDKVDSPLDKAGVFLGPYPSGAPAIFIDTAARLGHKSGIISGVGCDDFGKNLLDRLNSDGVDTSLVLRDPTCSTGCAFVMYYSNGDRKFIFHIGNTPAAKAKAPDTVPKIVSVRLHFPGSAAAGLIKPRIAAPSMTPEAPPRIMSLKR